MSDVYGLPYRFVKNGTSKFKLALQDTGEIIGEVHCHQLKGWLCEWTYKHTSWSTFAGPVRTRSMAAKTIYAEHQKRGTS